MHTYSRLTTAIAVLALATGGYALLQIDTTRDRLDRMNDTARALEADRSALRIDLAKLTARQRQSSRELDRRLDALDAVPKQIQELVLSMEELRGRAQGPERAWSRAEALFLLELAQHRLTLDRDVETAIVALESADLRLASLRDASNAPVRQQIARELQALRAVQRPDTAGVVARLVSAEEQAARAPLNGIVGAQRKPFAREDLPPGMLARAWAIARHTVAGLVVIREVDDRAGRVISNEEALLRRQHLQLLLFSARLALARHDAAGYRSALSAARQWLGEFFDLSTPSVQALLQEVRSLEPIEIDPALPDLSGSTQALRRLMPAPRPGPE